MRRPLVVGNWKMRGSSHVIHALLAAMRPGADTISDVDVCVCAPFVYLDQCSRQLAGSRLMLGAQNVGNHEPGDYTGEVSASMLLEFGCRYVIVGHSERRHHYGESSALVAARFASALRHGIIPVLCLGESLRERKSGSTCNVVNEQLDAVLDLCGVASLQRAVVAYEPVWAIGTGHTASAEQAQAVHAHIRQRIRRLSAEVADSLQLLYGGSVKPDNAHDLFAMPDIDGGLVGGASLDAAAFLAVCNAAKPLS
ncbi:MAG: hypothetical protein RIQ52_935 [Pseudomonadota bacterium]